jgi:zinc transport system ATP-binding protein
MTSDMAIKIDHLSFHYDNQNRLLENISAEIAKGECIAIFGPNGGGKTTFLKLLMGFLTPSSGTLLIDEEPPLKKREHMGYVPQISHLDRQFPITVIEVVKMGALNIHSTTLKKRDLDELALAMLEKVGLTSMAQKPFGALSGGQAQRTLIARAFISDPTYLFLDEPTANVDPDAEELFHCLIQEKKGKMTILMVTHDLPTVVSYIDRFFCIYRTLTPYSPEQVCGHFAQGLYHPPLQTRKDSS